MNKKIKNISYKGFQTSIRYSKIDAVFYGKIDNVEDLVIFESSTLDDFFPTFKDAVNDYLDYRIHTFLE